MKTSDFHQWLEAAQELTPSQIDQLYSWIGSQKQVSTLMSELRNRVDSCPHCEHNQIQRWGNAHGLPRYRCRQCCKTFNALTGTPLAGLRHREHWLTYTQALIDGVSIRKTADQCGIHKDTSFRWRHRFLSAISAIEPTHLSGIVEADETYFLESHKGERHLSRKPRHRGGKASKRGLSKEQIPVLVVRDRSGVTLDAVLTKADTESIRNVLEPVLDPDAVLCTDANPIYHAFTAPAHIEHRILNLSAGCRVIDHAYHIQNVNAYDSRLKGWMARFRGVATKYLPNYLGWRRALDKLRTDEMSPSRMLMQVVAP